MTLPTPTITTCPHCGEVLRYGWGLLAWCCKTHGWIIGAETPEAPPVPPESEWIEAQRKAASS